MILHQPRHALQRILSQTVYLESAFPYRANGS
ncbi:hypothetical protein LTSEHVI_4348, partial [Salmonella enterica subsp. enterica serovar Hvittingfoss str. A4-620]